MYGGEHYVTTSDGSRARFAHDRSRLPRVVRLPQNTNADGDESDRECDLGGYGKPLRAAGELAHEPNRLRQRDEDGREADAFRDVRAIGNLR